MRPQPLDQAIGAALGADEHQREVAVALQLLDERLDAVLKRVAEVGIEKLTRDERAFLDAESARLRNQRRDA